MEQAAGKERARAFTRMFGSAVVMQGVLSATNLVVSLILIRRTTLQQYGYFALIQTAMVLITGLQLTFIQPQMVVRMTGASAAAKADLVGGLYRDQRRIWPLLALAGLALALVLWWSRIWNTEQATVALAATATILASMFRDFFRMVMLAYRRPEAVLRADSVYAVTLVGAIFLATLTPIPATAATCGLGFAGLIGGIVCRRALRAFAPWNIHGAPGILRQIAPMGTWTASGSAIHWLFSQGYNFLVAATLGVAAVSSTTVTQKLIMPINLLSSGIGTIMLPTASGWLEHHRGRVVFRRLVMIAGALSLIAVCYYGVIWYTRDWIFANILKKSFAQRNELLLLWFGIGILMLFRDQLLYLPLARSRFRILTVLTAACAAVSLIVSFIVMRRIGVSGALIGVMTGEILSVLGLLALSEIEARRA